MTLPELLGSYIASECTRIGIDITAVSLDEQELLVKKYFKPAVNLAIRDIQKEQERRKLAKQLKESA